METVEQQRQVEESAPVEQPEQSEADSVTEESPKSEEAKPPQKVDASQQKKATPEGVKKGKEGWIQGRISRYASETRELREQLKQAQDEMRQIRQGQGGGQANTSGDGRPNQDDYAKFDDYVNAMVDWKIGQQSKIEARGRAEREAMQAYQRRRSTFDMHAQQYASLYDDPQAVMAAMYSDDNPISDAMGEAIMELGAEGPAVLLHLAQNPMEAMRISQLSPGQATMQIGIMGERLKTSNGDPMSQAAPQRPQPKPVPTLRGGSPSNAMGALPNSADSAHDWAQKEAARMRAKFGNNIRVYAPR